jgi:hypothetical protein
VLWIVPSTLGHHSGRCWRVARRQASQLVPHPAPVSAAAVAERCWLFAMSTTGTTADGWCDRRYTSICCGGR